MNRKILCLVAISMIVCASGQTQTIIDDLHREPRASDGLINVMADSVINALIGSPGGKVVALTLSDSIAAGLASAVDSTGYVSIYHVQVYSGNQQKARAEAQSRQAAVRQTFPNTPVYLTYNAPNFKVTAGDFSTREEAEAFKQQLARTLKFGREAFIVSTKVKYVPK
jgi:hypothetical protein